jgi:hypothetical protein
MLLLLGPPPSQAWLANRLKETAWPEAEAELEALRSLVTQVRYLVQGGVNGLSSLATSMSAVAELLGNRIDAAATNGIPFCDGCRRVTFPRAGRQSGGAWVQMQHGINRR